VVAGGNQHMGVLAGGLLPRPGVLVLAEPPRGQNT
jgi:hypothetical protein